MDIIGKWWLTLYESKTVMVEIGLGYNTTTTCKIFQVKTYRFFFMWLNIVRPTLLYFKEQRKYKYENRKKKKSITDN